MFVGGRVSVQGCLGILEPLFLPSPFLGTVPRSMTASTAVSSILRNPIYTVRSHRVVPCGSPPVPRDAGPQGLPPRYVNTPTLSSVPAVQSLGWRAIAEQRPCEQRSLLAKLGKG